MTTREIIAAIIALASTCMAGYTELKCSDTVRQAVQEQREADFRNLEVIVDIAQGRR